jgi:hypothetical protein
MALTIVMATPLQMRSRPVFPKECETAVFPNDNENARHFAGSFILFV